MCNFSQRHSFTNMGQLRMNPSEFLINLGYVTQFIIDINDKSLNNQQRSPHNNHQNIFPFQVNNVKYTPNKYKLLLLTCASDHIVRCVYMYV